MPAAKAGLRGPELPQLPKSPELKPAYRREQRTRRKNYDRTLPLMNADGTDHADEKLQPITDGGSRWRHRSKPLHKYPPRTGDMHHDQALFFFRGTRFFAGGLRAGFFGLFLAAETFFFVAFFAFLEDFTLAGFLVLPASLFVLLDVAPDVFRAGGALPAVACAAESQKCSSGDFSLGPMI